MHRVPKIFANSPNRRLTDADSGSGEGSSSSRHGAKPKPRLDRRNARKNINYSSEESLRMRSLYLNGGNTSLRIDGVDGEIDFLCQYLGFSGIDDFSINPDEYYVAMKVRSSSAPVVFSRTAEKVDYDDGGVEVVDSLNRVIEDSGHAVRYLDHCGEVVSGNSEENRDYRNIDRSRNDVFGGKLVDSVRVSEVILSNNVSGIKGARPPVLAAPPSISLPKIDKECSTWDLFRAFGPDNDTSISRFEREVCFKEDEASGRKRKQDEELEGGLRRGMAREENCVLAGLHSFTRNSNNDDSLSTITHPMSSISPDGRFCIISAWQKGGLLGRGSFGSVYEGIADDGFFFAAKEVSLLDQGDEGQQRINQLEQEIALLSRFQHENIVQYYGTAKDESHLYIFLELVNQGSLLSLYQKYTLKDSAVSGYTRQILHGLRYLHDRNVVHRDIKCANLLVDTNGSVKLADFGLAKATKLNDVKSCKGTAFWMAPEVVRSQGYGLAADIWSLGCTVLEMLTKRFPYANLECMPALFRIGKGERPPIPDSLSSDARDFILKCLQVDPNLRPTAAQLLDHPFVKRPLPSSLGFTSPRNSVRRN